MTGASEEEPADTPCGLLPAQLYQLQTMPDAVRQMPFVHLEIGSRYSDNQVRCMAHLVRLFCTTKQCLLLDQCL